MNTAQAGQPGVISTAPPAGTPPNPRFLTRELWFDVGAAGTLNYWRIKNVATNGSINFNFFIPTDLITLVSCELIGFPAQQVINGGYDLYANYAAIGELENTHITAVLGNTISIAQSTLFGIDLIPVIPNGLPGDFVGCFVQHVNIGTAIYYIGARMRYQT